MSGNLTVSGNNYLGDTNAIVSTSAPSAPTVGHVGAAGATTYGYKIAFRLPTGTSVASSQTSITNGNATLNGTHYNTITVPTCSLPGETVDIFLTMASGGAPDLGLLTNVACGATYNHQGADGDGDPPVSDTTVGLYVTDKFASPGRSTFGSTATFSTTSVINLEETFSTVDGNGISTSVSPADLPGLGAYRGGFFQGATLTASTNDYSYLIGVQADVAHRGIGGITYVIGDYFNVLNSGTADNLASMYGQSINNGTATNVYSLWADGLFNTGAITNNYGVYIGQTQNTDAGAVTTEYGIWEFDKAGVATNSYYEWYDSRGVFRIKEDSTFDSVGQAIPALYNPQFAKYVANAGDYERVVLSRWNGNVAEIGTEKGGTGTLRNLRLIGAKVDVPIQVLSLAFVGQGSIPSVATCGTIGTGSTNASGFINSATTGACVSVLTFTTAAPIGWSCAISNATTANLIRQTGSSTTSATFTGATISGDVLRYACIAY